MAPRNETLRNLILTDAPAFHYWGGKEQTGGFAEPQFKLLTKAVEEIASSNQSIVVETGAGLSTLWLLALGCKVFSYIADNAVVEKMKVFLEQYPDLLEAWEPLVGYSEETLPINVLRGDHPEVDICLIDGGHGLQTVFVDFVYCNYCLKQGGILIIDDLQLGSAKLLDTLLRMGRDYEFVEIAGNKTSAFRKILSRKFLPDHGSQSELMSTLSKALG